MADTQEQSLTTITALATGDKVRIIDDPGGTPVSSLITVGNFLKTAEINDTSADHQYIIAVSELTADRTITFPLLTGNDVFVFADFIQTLTNKRIKPRVTSETSSATPTINTDNSDIHRVTALAAAITSVTTNLSGTPNHGQELTVEITDNGTARAITWGASFASTDSGTLPTTTILGKLLRVKFMWDSADSTWDCVAVSNES